MLSLIPIPKQYTLKNGFFNLSEPVNVSSQFDLPLLEGKVRFCEEACFKIKKDSSMSAEGYRLWVGENSITVAASTKTGAYYALQSLRKLGKVDAGGKRIPCCYIDDEPRFKYRGISLDVSRHFFSVDEVKRYISLAFMQKLNFFHWHLTDDQGWRIEIKKYPLLTEIGSHRSYSQVGGWGSLRIENEPHGGFYTQDEIREIVDYAKERGITVVPEIDFPAHCASAIAAYNDLACRNIECEVPGYFGGTIPEKKDSNRSWNRTLCAGKQSTYDFIFGVLDEVCELFDAPYVHVGGDELPKGEWKKCPLCQETISKNNLKNENELQGWFTNKIIDYLDSKGKKLIGWNEILKSSVIDTSRKNIVVQYWTPRRDKRAEKYVNSGTAMIMSNHRSFYFDMPYAQYPLKNTYNYRPEKFGVNKDNIKNVLGIEGELWTEWIADPEKLQMQAFPRMLALAEVAWSPESCRNFSDFKDRLDDEKQILKALGVNYAADGISMPRSLLSRANIRKNFHNGNTYLEVELNKNYKTKGEW